MMLFRQIFLLCFLTLTCFSQNNFGRQIIGRHSVGRQSLWQSIGIKDGLSQGMVYDMVQNQEGFIWVATKDGLNRYDGYSFKVFTNDPYNENSISGNICTALLEDKQGRIWVGTEKDGLNLFDKKTQRFYHANIIDANLKNAGNYNIFRFRLDASGNVWIFTDDPTKIFKIKPFDGFPTDKDFTTQIEKVKLTEFQKNITFKLDRQSISYDLSKVILSRQQPDIFEGIFLKNANFSNYIKDNQHWIWLLSKTKIYGRKGNAQREITFEGGEEASVMNQFEDGTLVIANQEYMWLFSPQELLKTDKLTPQNAYAKIPPNCILFTKDREGNIWIGTRGYGLLKYNPQDRRFKSYLPNHSPSFLFQDMEGRTYFHANYLPSYHFYQYNTNDNTFAIVLPNVSGKALGHEAILQDNAHQFWLLCNKRFEKKRVLMKFTKDWKLLKEYVLPPLDVFNDINAKMNLDKNGNIWIGLTNGSLYLFDPQTEQVKTYNYHDLLPQNGAFVQTYALLQDQNTIWIGTQKGLIKGENLTIKPVFSIYKNSKTNRQSLSNDFVSGIINDPFLPDKYLWVSTKGGGLERLDKQTGIFEHFTEAQGLPNRVVYGVLEGDDKNLWVSTNRGIARLNTKSLNFTNFNKSDGIQDEEFNTNAYFKAPTGELLFGGVNGFTVFRASEIGKIKTQPAIKIIGLKVNNKTVELNDGTEILSEAIENLPKLDLSYDQNLLTLEFGLMNFTNTIKNRFRYQLEGIDDEWVETRTNHFANYAQLPSGHYTFKVMGTTDGEVWSKVTELQIRVNPPFYRSWWAYLFYTIVLGYVGYRWYQYQINQVRLQQEILFKNKEASKLQELDHLKTKFFTNISHEFRTPLTLLVGPIDDLQKKYPQEGIVAVMQRNLQRLQNLINQLLDISKLEAGEMKLNLQEVDLKVFLNQLFASFESLAHAKNIDFNFTQLQASHFTSFDIDKLEKIVTNLLSNAFKFTPENGRISVSIKATPTAPPKSSPMGRTSSTTPFWGEGEPAPSLLGRVGVGFGAELSISIQDSGIGIDEQRIPHIFDRFYQVDDHVQRSHEGTGIGLALVKELVDLLNGRIDVNSEFGRGTTFKVSLPYLPLEKLSNTAVRTADKPNLAESLIDPKIKVATTIDPDGQPIMLIVEDNTDLRNYIASIFENQYQLILAVDGEDGSAKAVEFIPDIVISDLMMPKLDGLGLCEKLKNDERTNHIPIVMLTAKASLADKLSGLEHGADDYLSKPFNRGELQIRVANLVKQRERLKAKYNQISTEEKVTNKPPSMEDKFMQKAYETIENNIINSNFDVEQFCDAMAMSRPTMHRKLKALADQSTSEFIRNYRLQKAAKLLKNKAGTVSEIAYQVGFENLSYFSKTFQEKFGFVPSEWK